MCGITKGVECVDKIPFVLDVTVIVPFMKRKVEKLPPNALSFRSRGTPQSFTLCSNLI